MVWVPRELSRVFSKLSDSYSLLRNGQRAEIQEGVRILLSAFFYEKVVGYIH